MVDELTCRRSHFIATLWLVVNQFGFWVVDDEMLFNKPEYQDLEIES